LDLSMVPAGTRVRVRFVATNSRGTQTTFDERLLPDP
jgi:hypothetical protein